MRYIYYYLLSLTVPARLRVVLVELEADAIDAMPLIRRRVVPFTLEYMTQVATALTTHDLSPLHAKTTIGMTSHSARDAVKICRPSAA